jgi:hypothetical protein
MELVAPVSAGDTATDRLDLLMEPVEVSTYLGVPVGTLANWRYQALGPAYIRVGRHVRYRRADVARWVEAQLDRPQSARRRPRRSRKQ